MSDTSRSTSLPNSDCGISSKSEALKNPEILRDELLTFRNELELEREKHRELLKIKAAQLNRLKEEQHSSGLGGKTLMNKSEQNLFDQHDNDNAKSLPLVEEVGVRRVGVETDVKSNSVDVERLRRLEEMQQLRDSLQRNKEAEVRQIILSNQGDSKSNHGDVVNKSTEQRESPKVNHVTESPKQPNQQAVSVPSNSRLKPPSQRHNNLSKTKLEDSVCQSPLIKSSFSKSKPKDNISGDCTFFNYSFENVPADCTMPSEHKRHNPSLPSYVVSASPCASSTPIKSDVKVSSNLSSSSSSLEDKEQGRARLKRRATFSLHSEDGDVSVNDSFDDGNRIEQELKQAEQPDVQPKSVETEKGSQMSKRVLEMTTQVGLLEKRVTSLKQENDQLKKKSEEHKQSEEKIRQLKKRNSELATTAKRLEEKLKLIQKGSIQDVSPRMAGGQMRQSRGVENDQLMIERDRTIERLREKCQQLLRQVQSSQDDQIRLQEMKTNELNYESLMKQATKERLQLEKQLTLLSKKQKLNSATTTLNSESLRVKLLEEQNLRLQQEVDQLTALLKDKEQLEIELVQRRIEVESLEKQAIESEKKYAELDNELQRVTLANTELTVFNSDLQKRVDDLEQMGSNYAVLETRLTEAVEGRETAEKEVQDLTQKLETLQCELQYLQQAEQKKQAIEGEKELIAEQLRIKQLEVEQLVRSGEEKASQQERAIEEALTSREEMKSKYAEEKERRVALSVELERLQALLQGQQQQQEPDTEGEMEGEGRQAISSVGDDLRALLQVYQALYSYDPSTCSPNETHESELTITEGDYIFVCGDMDEDGFYYGELMDGSRGLVPSNLIRQLNDEVKLALLVSGRVSCIKNSPQGKRAIIVVDVLGEALFSPDMKENGNKSCRFVVLVEEELQEFYSAIGFDVQPGKPITAVNSDHVTEELDSIGQLIANQKTPKKALNMSDDISLDISNITSPEKPMHGVPEAPVSVQIESGCDAGSVVVSWLPVTISPEGRSNGVIVAGYALYSNSRLVSTVHNATDDHVIVSCSDLIGSSSVLPVITVRTVAADGKESLDSQPVSIPTNLLNMILPNLDQPSSPRDIVLREESDSVTMESRDFNISNGNVNEILAQELQNNKLQSNGKSLQTNKVNLSELNNERTSKSGTSVKRSVVETKTSIQSSHNGSMLAQSNESNANVPEQVLTNFPDSTANISKVSETKSEHSVGVNNTENRALDSARLNSEAPSTGFEHVTDSSSITAVNNSSARTSVSGSGSLSSRSAPRLPSSVEIPSSGTSLSSGGGVNKDRISGISLPTCTDSSSSSNSHNTRGNNNNALDNLDNTRHMSFLDNSHNNIRVNDDNFRAEATIDDQHNDISMNHKSDLHFSNHSLFRPVLRVDSNSLSTLSTHANDHSPFLPLRGEPPGERGSEDESSITAELVNNNVVTRRHLRDDISESDLIDYSDDGGESLVESVATGEASLSTAHIRLFISLYDYDPETMSPNPDAASAELPFSEGQIIKIYGDKDEDGFYVGECNGMKGYVPCNMISEIHVDDPDVAAQLMRETCSRQPILMNGGSEASSRATSRTSEFRTHSGYSAAGPNDTADEADRLNHDDDDDEDDDDDDDVDGRVRYMVALYDYNPLELSPNMDAEEELSFRKGDVIEIFGDMDEDGFFYGSLRGQRGLVPSNFLQDQPLTHAQLDSMGIKMGDGGVRATGVTAGR